VNEYSPPLVGAATISQRLRDLGFELPKVARPAGSYVPYVHQNGQLYLSGQISKQHGDPAFVGKVGRDWSLDAAREAARMAAMDLLAQIAAATGDDFKAVRRVVRVGGFVNATEDFTQISAVIDAASDLLVEVFGENGRHARTAIGVATLPRGAAVELDAIVMLGEPSIREYEPVQHWHD
jgi:enamine deaminase RidA (YjgF/YER057c/UK114 family)